MRETNPDLHVIHDTNGEPDLTIPRTPHREVGYTAGTMSAGIPKAIDTESIDCYCKETQVNVDGNNLRHFYIKIGISGYLFDPWGMFSEGSEAKEARHLGRDVWNFRPVTKLCYENYLRFLMTRNKAYFTTAQREMRENA